MQSSRKLALRREVLSQLEPVELGGVAGGAPPTHYCGVTHTCFSCYTFVSCNPLDCVARPLSLPECIAIEDDPTVLC